MSTEGRRVFWITILLASVLMLAGVSMVVQTPSAPGWPAGGTPAPTTTPKDSCQEYVEYVDTEGVPALIPACSIPLTHRNSDK